LKAGVYSVEFRHTFYDVDVAGETYIKIEISGVEGTDYHLRNFELADGGYDAARNSITFKLELSGLIKVETSVDLSFKIYIPNNNSRGSGFGHGQTNANLIRQNKLLITKMNSGTEIDNNSGSSSGGIGQGTK
jgi:hypothetical protein